MRIHFANTEHAILVDQGKPAVLQVENQALFTRICQSLLSLAGQESLEPFSVWDDDAEEIRPDKALMTVANPLELPWGHKDLLPSANTRVEKLLEEDERAQLLLQECNSTIMSTLLKASHQMTGEYCFNVEWNVRTYLKAFGFSVDRSRNTTLLDNLISFVDLVADSMIDKALLFFNLKNYLTKNELALLYEQVFSRSIRLLSIENHDATSYPDLESKLVIDQDFIEYEVRYQSVRTSLTQEGICPIGFGAVTF